MGLDLALLVEEGREWTTDKGMKMLAYTRLSLDRNYGIFDQIKGEKRPFRDCDCKATVPVALFPVPVKVYQDEGLIETTADAHENPLTFATAGDLSGIVLGEQSGAWNLAVFAFLRALPPETRIVLWWH